MASDPTQTSSLWDALASVRDHRRAEGRRYPLASLLLIAIAAMLAGRLLSDHEIRLGSAQTRQGQGDSVLSFRGDFWGSGAAALRF